MYGNFVVPAISCNLLARLYIYIYASPHNYACIFILFFCQEVKKRTI